VHLAKSAEDVCHAIDLAGQSVTGKNTLARLAHRAPCQHNRQLDILAAHLEPAAHPAVGELDVGGLTLGADATRKNFVTAPRDVLSIVGRLHHQYVNHHVLRRPRLLGRDESGPSLHIYRRMAQIAGNWRGACREQLGEVLRLYSLTFSNSAGDDRRLRSRRDRK